MKENNPSIRHTSTKFHFVHYFKITTTKLYRLKRAPGAEINRQMIAESSN